eukprot:1575767-Amphidinium_carterae.1
MEGENAAVPPQEPAASSSKPADPTTMVTKPEPGASVPMSTSPVPTGGDVEMPTTEPPPEKRPRSDSMERDADEAESVRVTADELRQLSSLCALPYMDVRETLDKGE